MWPSSSDTPLPAWLHTEIRPALMDTQSHEERQEDEVECLEYIFMSDFVDLRKKDSWKVIQQRRSRRLCALTRSAPFTDKATSGYPIETDATEEHGKWE